METDKICLYDNMGNYRPLPLNIHKNMLHVGFATSEPCRRILFISGLECTYDNYHCVKINIYNLKDFDKYITMYCLTNHVSENRIKYNRKAVERVFNG